MNRVFGIGFHRKGTSEQKFKEAWEYVTLIFRKSVLDGIVSAKAQGSSMLGAQRDRKEARVAGVERAQGKEIGHEF